MRFARAILVLSLVSLFFLACSTTTATPANAMPAAHAPALPEGDPGIRGTIAEVMLPEEEVPLRLMIKSGAQYDIVSITPHTRIYLDDAGVLRDASVADLTKGAMVTAWYDGAVRESFPRQAIARAIVIAGKR